MHVNVHTYVCKLEYMYVCIYMCICIHAHISVCIHLCKHDGFLSTMLSSRHLIHSTRYVVILLCYVHCSNRARGKIDGEIKEGMMMRKKVQGAEEQCTHNHSLLQSITHTPTPLIPPVHTHTYIHTHTHTHLQAHLQILCTFHRAQFDFFRQLRALSLSFY